MQELQGKLHTIPLPPGLQEVEARIDELWATHIRLTKEREAALVSEKDLQARILALQLRVDASRYEFPQLLSSIVPINPRLIYFWFSAEAQAAEAEAPKAKELQRKCILDSQKQQVKLLRAQRHVHTVALEAHQQQLAAEQVAFCSRH